MTLTAVVTGSDAVTVVWTGDTGAVDGFSAPGNGAAATFSPITLPADLGFTASASAGDATDGSATTTFSLPGFATNSGAALSGQQVTLLLSDTVPADWADTAVWTQVDGDLVTLTDGGDGTASFVAPIVTDSTTFEFEVTTDGCAGLAGRTEVAVQTATISLDLPDTIAEGSTVDLAAAVTLTNAPANTLLLYFVQSVVPAGADLQLDQVSGELGVVSGAGSNVTIAVQVFSTAGLLGQATDTFAISAAP